MSIQNCLPQLARQQYVRVRNQKSESARESYRAKLTDLRAQSAANGVLRSGYQELAEWKLAEELFGQLAYSWFEAAIETCKLYEIPLDQNLCKCIETDVRELLIGQYQNSLNHAGSPAGAVKVPLSARNKLSGHLQRSPRRRPRPVDRSGEYQSPDYRRRWRSLHFVRSRAILAVPR